MSFSRENHIYYTKMKTIPKVTINLHGKLELSEQAKTVLKNRKFGYDDCRQFLKEYGAFVQNKITFGI